MEIKSWFLKNGYPRSLVEKELGKVKFSNEVGNKPQGIPFVVTYYPILKKIGNIIKKILYLLCVNEEAKKVFTLGHMVSCRSARKLSSNLVRAKLYPIERTVGSLKCSGKRCQTCLNVNETDACTTTGKTYKINYQFNCNSKYLVYFLTCKVCLKQYVGQTVEDFRLRWNNYKSNDRKYQKLESCMQQHLFDHFNSEGHHCFLDEISIPFIQNRPFRTFKKTMTPWGLNVEDSI